MRHESGELLAERSSASLRLLSHVWKVDIFERSTKAVLDVARWVSAKRVIPDLIEALMEGP